MVQAISEEGGISVSGMLGGSGAANVSETMMWSDAQSAGATFAPPLPGHP